MREKDIILGRDPLIWISLVALPVFLVHIGTPALSDAEAMYAQIAREMRETGDWITPHLNGNRHFDKPPLIFWLVAVAQTLFGPSEASARFWPALAAWGTIPLVGFMGRSLYGFRTGWMAAIIFAACLGPFIYGSMLMPDSVLIFWITLSMLAYIKGFALQRNNLWLWVMFASIGFSTLTKGILGLGLSSAAIGIHVLLSGRLKEFLRWPFWVGGLVFSAVSVPWHFAVAKVNGDFLEYYFIREHIHRFTGQRYPSDEHVPLALFLILTFFWTFPWICMVPQALWKAVQRVRSSIFKKSLDLLPLVWIAFFLLLFSASKSRLEYYALPAIPAFALLLGKFWSDATTRSQKGEALRSLTIPLTVMAPLMGLVALLAFALLGPAKEVVLGMLDRAWPTGGIDGAQWQRAILDQIRLPATFTFAAVAIFCGAALAAVKKQRPIMALFLLAAMMIPFFMLTQWGFRVVEPYQSAKTVAIMAAERTSPEDMIIFQEPHEYMWVGGMAYYTERPVYILKDPQFDNLPSRRREPPERFLDKGELFQLWGSSRKVVLVGNDVEPLLSQLERVASPRLVGRNGPWVVAENH